VWVWWWWWWLGLFGGGFKSVRDAVRRDVCVLVGLGEPFAFFSRYLVEPASSHMLVSKIKPCMPKYKPSLYGKTANGSLNQL